MAGRILPVANFRCLVPKLSSHQFPLKFRDLQVQINVLDFQSVYKLLLLGKLLSAICMVNCPSIYISTQTNTFKFRGLLFVSMWPQIKQHKVCTSSKDQSIFLRVSCQSREAWRVASRSPLSSVAAPRPSQSLSFPKRQCDLKTASVSFDSLNKGVDSADLKASLMASIKQWSN